MVTGLLVRAGDHSFIAGKPQPESIPMDLKPIVCLVFLLNSDQ